MEFNERLLEARRKGRPCPQCVERLALFGADTDSHELNLVLHAVLNDLPLSSEAIGASLEADRFHFNRGGRL